MFSREYRLGSSAISRFSWFSSVLEPDYELLKCHLAFFFKSIPTDTPWNNQVVCFSSDKVFKTFKPTQSFPFCKWWGHTALKLRNKNRKLWTSRAVVDKGGWLTMGEPLLWGLLVTSGSVEFNRLVIKYRIKHDSGQCETLQVMFVFIVGNNLSTQRVGT